MDRIETYEQCIDVIKQFRENASHVKTNFYMLPDEMKKMIISRTIYYQMSHDLLVFYIEESDYLHVYYWITDRTFPIINNGGKTMVLDLVARDMENDEEQRWKKAGFESYKLYSRMKNDLTVWHGRGVGVWHGDTYLISSASVTDIKGIAVLWRACLDCYSTPLPTLAEVEQLAATQHIYCMRQEQKMIAAVYMEVASKSCILKHLSVDPLYRRQGLGSALMNYALNKMVEEGIKNCVLWVDIENIPAYENYVKSGFKQDGLWSRQMIRRRS